MAKVEDLTGHAFGKLKVLKRTDNSPSNNAARWLCACECGNLRKITTHNVRKEKYKSCGCLNKSGRKPANLTLTERVRELNGLWLTKPFIAQ